MRTWNGLRLLTFQVICIKTSNTLYTLICTNILKYTNTLTNVLTNKHTHTHVTSDSLWSCQSVSLLSRMLFHSFFLPSSATHLYLSLTPVTKTHCYCSSFKSMSAGKNSLSESKWKTHWSVHNEIQTRLSVKRAILCYCVGRREPVFKMYYIDKISCHEYGLLVLSV